MTAFDFMEGDSDYRAAAEAKAERKTAVEVLAAQPAVQIVAAAAVDATRLVRVTAAYDALVAALEELANDTTETEYLRLRAGDLLAKNQKEHPIS